MDSDNNDAVSDSEDNSQFNVADDSQQSLGMVESSQNSSRKRDILKARKERDSKSKAARRLIDSQQDRQVDAVGNPNVKPRSDAVSRRSLSQKRRDASRKAKRRSEETEADKIVRKHKNAAQMSARRSEEPDDVRAQRNMSDAERKMRARSEEPDDVREKRNSTNAKRTAVKRSEELPETKRKRNVSNANRMSSKRSKDAEYSSDFSVLKSNSIHGNTQKPKCKIRISFVDLLDLETQCIVIPHYGSVNQVDRSAIYNQYWKRLEDGREDYKEFLDSLDLKEFTPEVYPCEGRNQFHIQAPVMDKSGFTLVTETALRATYLSCLHRADLNGSRSIGFPILGKGISRRMSVALALQTFFAYFNSSPSRNIQLVYLVTKNMDECDDIASFTSYIREIDFSQWTIQQYFKFEDLLFDKIGEKCTFSTIPGTGFIWRAVSSGYTSRRKKVESDSAQNIHDIIKKAESVDPEIYFRETPSGMPPHRLRLKVGAQCVLLRNQSVALGLCNGTRLTLERFGIDVIYFSINNPTATSGKEVFLHRVKMTPSGKKNVPAEFTRLQYPIRLAYASTVNKSQGMTLSRCGLVLHSNVFSHGQLYVAMSRVRRGEDFRLWHYRRHLNDDFHVCGGILVRNVVFNDILRESGPR